MKCLRIRLQGKDGGINICKRMTEAEYKIGEKNFSLMNEREENM